VRPCMKKQTTKKPIPTLFWIFWIFTYFKDECLVVPSAN
jgi:hypothetical protein